MECQHENESERIGNPNQAKDDVYAEQLESIAADMTVSLEERKEQDVLKSEGNMMSSDGHF